MEVAVGTSGYAYKEWRGSFYPEKLAADAFLSHYASRLRTVEINNTFYRVPKRTVVANWAEQAPDGFEFVLKATQRITHKLKLKDCEEPLGYMTRAAEHLGSKRGPMLFQLPPWLRRDDELLRDFLAMLPEDARAAMEFRHRSWFEDDVYAALRESGVALVISQSEKFPDPAVVGTADDTYFRLRNESYTEAELDAWAEHIASGSWKRAYVFFKHEDDAAGPLLAEKFQTRFAS